MGKEVTTYLCCEIAVDRKIVPFERVPDHAGGNYSASLGGAHLTPNSCLSSRTKLSIQNRSDNQRCATRQGGGVFIITALFPLPSVALGRRRRAADTRWCLGYHTQRAAKNC